MNRQHAEQARFIFYFDYKDDPFEIKIIEGYTEETVSDEVRFRCLNNEKVSSMLSSKEIFETRLEAFKACYQSLTNPDNYDQMIIDQLSDNAKKSLKEEINKLKDYIEKQA